MGRFGGSKKGEPYVSLTKAVTLAITPEALSASHIFVEWVTIQALDGNVAVGGSNVNLATGIGTQLAKLNTKTLSGVYLDEVFIDVVTDGHSVGYDFVEKRK